MQSEFPHTLHPDLQLVLDYWSDLKTTLARLPALDEIDLMDLWEVAPKLFIADFEESADQRSRFRWRYWGTGLVEYSGAELTGKYFDQTHTEEAVVEAGAVYRWVLESGEPHYWRQGVRTIDVDKTFLSYERIVLPLLNREGKPGHLLGIAVPIEAHAPDHRIRSGKLEFYRD